ncbi:MAG: hypothetical protein QOC77_1644 [Thermoleophilaceae bacterium]|nr:hypothetical protein [Thermoleophilaceae bacterium]
MILWRVFPWEPRADPTEAGGALLFPRSFQGVGRHDNPKRYGCLYASLSATSGVAEILAQFRGEPLREAMLAVAGTALAIAPLELPNDAELIDLDEPRVLQRERLRPSGVATRRRDATQAYAERLFDAHPESAGLRWWSTLESTWINVTLFDRAAGVLAAGRPERLTPDQPAVAEAAELLGLA